MMCISGGIWLWEQSSCDLDRVHLHGGASYAISIDKTYKAQLKVSKCMLPCILTASDSHTAGQNLSHANVMRVSENAHKLLLLQGCYINGSLHMDDKTWKSVQTVQQQNADPNTFIAAKATVYWPFEEGPFVYEANMLTA